jgi:uncharacterized protein
MMRTACPYPRRECISSSAVDWLDEHPWDVRRSPLPEAVSIKDVAIPMRDGTRLTATVFRDPGAPGPVPVIAAMTPYLRKGYDQWEGFRDPPLGHVEDFYMGTVEISDHTAFEAPDPGHWVPRGYAVVLIDYPGRGGSGSRPEDPPPFATRWADAMAWMEAQDWSTGKVGLSGVSALCINQWVVGADPPPQLAALVAWEGFNEHGPGGGYGGIPEVGFLEWLREHSLGPSLNPDADGPEPESRQWTFELERIEVPALVCASFSDHELHTWGSAEAFRRMRTPHKWLFSHRRQKWGAYYGAEELALQECFLARFLKGEAAAMDGVPRVRVEVNRSRFEREVMTFEEWPPAGTEYREVDLGAEDRAIAPSPAGDPANRAVFDFPIEEPTLLLGYPTLHLTVAVEEATDADLFVALEKLDAAGEVVHFFGSSGGNANAPLSRGWLRLSKRAVDARLSDEHRTVLSLDRNEPLVPGEPIAVTIPLMPCGARFEPGETLRLVIQSWCVRGAWDGAEPKRWLTHTEGRTRILAGDGRSRLRLPLLAG